MRAQLRSVSMALAALFAATAWAQQVLFMAPFGPGESKKLLRQESVQKELKLTPDDVSDSSGRLDRQGTQFLFIAGAAGFRRTA